MAAAHHGSELSGAELDAESDGVYVTNVLPPLFKVFRFWIFLEVILAISLPFLPTT